MAFIVKGAAPRLLLTGEKRAAELAGLDCPVLTIEEAQAHGGARVEAGVSGARPAYIAYTSGSTGGPKGALTEPGMGSRCPGVTEHWYHFGSDDVWPLFHPITFDFSVWEMWGALAYGGRLVIVPRDVPRSPHDLYALLQREKATVLCQTPSAFRGLAAFAA